MQQVDDRLQAVLSAFGQCSIPERPVVMTRFRLGQTPWCAVSNDLDAESGNRAKVVDIVLIVATLRELVLSIRNSIGKHHRIGAFFADGPCKVRKRTLTTNPVHHRVANLAEPATPSPPSEKAQLRG